MIVRIMGEGQFQLDDDCINRLNAIDEELGADIEAKSTEHFATHLQDMVSLVRSLGKPVPDDELVPSDAVIPPPDISLAELEALLGSEGLVPG